MDGVEGRGGEGGFGDILFVEGKQTEMGSESGFSTEDESRRSSHFNVDSSLAALIACFNH